MKKTSAKGGLAGLSPEERAALKARVRADIEATSDEEDAAVTAAAAQDPDNLPNVFPARRGRPPLAVTKEKVPLRLDPDVVEHFRATGPGWQTRINDVLRKAAGL